MSRRRSTTTSQNSGQGARRVVVIITGGVAAFKALEVLRTLIEDGCEVRTVLTSAAREFVGVQAVAAIAHEDANEHLFGAAPSLHTELADWADMVVVIPATADFLAKMAQGFADDLASTLLLAFSGPVVVAPAMHSAMWLSPATQRNVGQLVADGTHVIGPAMGRLAGGDVGVGRLVDPHWVHEAVRYWGNPSAISLRGRRICVSAGGTREAIDDVRFIGNRSSGRQGWAIAEVAAIAGATVRCVSTVEPPFPPDLVELVRVESASEMLAAMLDAQADCDILIMNAAVADYRLAVPLQGKLKRQGHETLDLELVANPDILAELVKNRIAGQLIVGFAAEVEHLEASVADKLTAKGVDLMVGNNVAAPGSEFGSLDNAVFLLDRFNHQSHLPLGPKTEIAAGILAAIVGLSEV